jgi:uncharacterized protein DUF5367
MRRLLLAGFLIWAGATIALRLGGQYVFRTTGTAAAVSLLAVSLPIMVAVALLVLRNTAQWAVGAIYLVAPGMLLDTISSIWFSKIFPNIRSDGAGLFGGWLLFCNVVVLLTAIAHDHLHRNDSGGQRRRSQKAPDGGAEGAL